LGDIREVDVVRLSVDRARCEGFGYCEDQAPELLHLDDEGDLVLDVELLDDVQAVRAQAAARVCPVAALRVESEAIKDAAPTDA
jgi:ferredoxin